MLNNQVFSAQGEKSLKKLLRMFEEGRSTVGLEALDYFRMKNGENDGTKK